jgi:hypothetical protein
MATHRVRLTFEVFVEHGGECEARAIEFALREMFSLVGVATVADGHGAILSGSVSEVAAAKAAKEAPTPTPDRNAN